LRLTISSCTVVFQFLPVYTSFKPESIRGFITEEVHPSNQTLTTMFIKTKDATLSQHSATTLQSVVNILKMKKAVQSVWRQPVTRKEAM
jgi:hypothetical protein